LARRVISIIFAAKQRLDQKKVTNVSKKQTSKARSASSNTR